MANTYTQISIHAIFAVKHRENFITKEWRDRLHSYISGVLKNEDTTSLSVGGWLDHVHVFFGMPPTKNISDIMRVVKTNSSKWINENDLVKGKFQWQEGYAAFSYSRSQRDTVINYIMQQEEHHKKKSFKDEYIEMLKTFEVDFDEKYLFEFYE
jgi:REP element-mobilizing transposase RayT